MMRTKFIQRLRRLKLIALMIEKNRPVYIDELSFWESPSKFVKVTAITNIRMADNEVVDFRRNIVRFSNVTEHI